MAFLYASLSAVNLGYPLTDPVATCDLLHSVVLGTKVFLRDGINCTAGYDMSCESISRVDLRGFCTNSYSFAKQCKPAFSNLMWQLKDVPSSLIRRENSKDKKAVLCDACLTCNASLPWRLHWDVQMVAGPV